MRGWTRITEEPGNQTTQNQQVFRYTNPYSWDWGLGINAEVERTQRCEEEKPVMNSEG